MEPWGGGLLGLGNLLGLPFNQLNNNQASATALAAAGDSSARLATGEAYISLSITGGNCTNQSANICITSPTNGGVAAGSHTLTVDTNSYHGYNVTLIGAGDKTNLEQPGRDSIQSATAELTNPTTLTAGQWGVAVPGLNNNFNFDYATGDLNQAKFAGIPTSQSNHQQIMQSTTATQSAQQTVYYGVKTDTTNVASGDYQGGVVYTATAQLPDRATITSMSPVEYRIGGTDSKTITIKGQNLASAYSVYIDLNGNGVADAGEACAITSTTDDTVTATIPAVNTIETGAYDVYVVTQSTPTPVVVGTKFNYYKMRNICTSELCVSIDPHMIPVRYTGTDTNAQWSVVTDSQLASSTTNWFNYDNKIWANAVTVKADKLDKYLSAEKGSNTNVVIPEDDILGYWVYIPRYAYEVMRYQASDKFVAAQNFNIKFEKATTPKKIPATSCNKLPTEMTAADMWINGTPNNTASNIKAKDYRTGCNISRTYGAATGTTWATHPAFTYGDEELNGFWMAKFELTGKITEPTVKPNRFANVANYIGEYWDSITSIGRDDPNNTGGGGRTSWSGTDINGNAIRQSLADIKQNSHSLGILTANVALNSQWGATTYLSASKYGAGVNAVYNNTAKIWSCTNNKGENVYCRDDDGDAVTSCDNGKSCFESGATPTNGGYGGNQTGCGPATNYDPNSVNAAASTAPYFACSANTSQSYQGAVGRLASTTRNVYGVYDMAGANWDYVASNLTDRYPQTASSAIMATSVMQRPASGRYVNLKNSQAGYDIVNSSSALNNPSQRLPWSVANSGTTYYVQHYNNDFCTWTECGGEALHETRARQSVNAWGVSWGGDGGSFSYRSYTWLRRGGRLGDTSGAGLFASYSASGGSHGHGAVRAALSGR